MKAITRKAPILLSVYDRPHHFQACIESLRKNRGADETVLYISSDGPLCDQSAKKVYEVRSYIKSIHGFKKINVFAPKENTQKKIILDAMDNIMTDNDIYITSEDDNIFAPSFLDFINIGLEIHAENTGVYAICGYNYPGFPLTRPLKSIPLRCFCPWGVGNWRDRSLPRNFSQKNLMSQVFTDRTLFSEINYAIPNMVPMMKNILDDELDGPDVTRNVLLFKENKICIFPSQSLVKNIGHDGSGEHCKVDDAYMNQDIFIGDVTTDRKMTIIPSDHHTNWLRQFKGGYLYSALGWLIYLEANAQSGIFRFAISCVKFFLKGTVRIRRVALSKNQ